MTPSRVIDTHWPDSSFPRPAAQVDDSLAGCQQPPALLDLEQLVNRARPVSLALGALVVGVLALVAGQGRARTH